MNTVLVVPDRFKQRQNNLVATNKAIKPSVRRPTRGIQIKEDTFATIRLVAGDGGKITLIDAGSNSTDLNNQPIIINGKRWTDIYSNFLLQHTHEERMEKMQVLETFGEPYIFLFGERPRVITFQGILLNTQDFNWEAEWWYNYDNFLRGTKAVENDARAFITYDTTLVSGYIISASAEKDSNQPYFMQFTFQLFLTDYNNFSDIGNPYAEPGLSLVATNLGTNQSSQQLVTSSAAAGVFTPKEIPASVGSADVANFNAPLSLTDGFTQAIAAVSQAWNQAQAVVNNTLTGVAGLLNGDVVRVPYGFAGALEFDEADATPLLVEPEYGWSTKFGMYSDNTDEYVGVGSQYGSSGVGNVWDQLPAYTQSQNLTYDQQMVDTATQEWAAQGFTVPGSASGTLISGDLGLLPIVLGSTASTNTNLGTANPPFGAGLSATGLPF
jgi:hypothetical protein